MTAPELELTPGLRHETAVVDPTAVIQPSVSIGPYAVIGPNVHLGARVRVGPHVFIERDTRVGEDCFLAKGAVLGTDPQDLKYGGEATLLEVGARTIIREYATLNRGTAATGITRVGADCLLMAYAHVAHDCRIGDHVILANAVNMGGHVQIEAHASVGGVTAIHQFVRIGAHSFIGGGSRVPQDVAPYTIVAGNPCRAYGLNLVGLRRRGFSKETLVALRNAYRQVFQSELNIGRALDRLEEEPELIPEVRRLISFVRSSRRGIVTGRAATLERPSVPAGQAPEPRENRQ
ncbi:MAG: acyl-ACP--UDP-N-acetylglucosamine O-acyltransferase [Gemmatimonadota bacterium]